MFEKAIQDVHRIAEGPRDDNGMEASELVRGKVVIGHAVLGVEVFTVRTGIDRPHRHHESEPVRRRHFAPAPLLCQGDGGLSVDKTRIRAGEGTLGKFLNDDTIARSVSSTTANLNEITGRINRGEGTAGRLISDRALYDRLNSMSDRLDKVMAGLQQGEGTAGRLLRDRELYENMNGAVGELRQLVRDIRADPRKFLNVRVSIF